MISIILGAFAGGFLLNLAPCIMPVLSLKILNFIKISEGRASTRILHGVLYSLGVILSFLVLALMTISIKLSGGYALFGLHLLGSKWIGASVGCITALLGAYYIWGKGKIVPAMKMAWRGLKCVLGPPASYLFNQHDTAVTHKKIEKSNITLGDWLYRQKEKAPLIGTFLQGALTTLLGSACCGPILAWAMGLALAGSVPLILFAFLAAGLGMALPYLILSLIPGLKCLVPKSGRWMGWVETISGILLICTGLWLIFL